MIHKLTMGHFDVEALNIRKVVVLRPLDMRVATRLLQQVGHVAEDGGASLGGHPVEIKDRYINCSWLMAERVLAPEEFARQLQQETGCVLYDAARRQIVTLQEMAGWWNRIRGFPGLRMFHKDDPKTVNILSRSSPVGRKRAGSRKSLPAFFSVSGVARAASTSGLTRSLTKRTDPSAMAKSAPPD